MRIVIMNGRKMFSIDGIPEEPIERLQETEGYLEVVCEVKESNISYQDIRKPRITISWEDQEQRQFSISTRDVWGLRGILQTFPFLQIPFHYKPRKK